MTSSVVAMADGTFSLSPIVLAEGETRTVTVSLSNEEKIQNIDLTIQLPAGLEFVKNTFVKGSRLSQDVAAAAVAAVLIVGGALWRAGTWPAPTQWNEDECVAYIYGERTTDRDIVLCEMQKTMTVVTCEGSDVVEEQLKGIFGIE